MLLMMTRQKLEILLVCGIFIALFITLGMKLRKHNEIVAVIVLCGSLTALFLLYVQRHPEVLDMLENHPTLTLLGLIISVGILVYRLFIK